MIIPLDTLSHDILDAIITEFISREGTEYGLNDYSLAEKITQVKAQLDQGTALIVYSELHETVNIVSAENFKAEFAPH